MLKTSFFIKIAAAFLMIIDHLGLMFNLNVLHYPGRYSFPLFAYLISQGFQRTSNPTKYMERLLKLAVFTQPLYLLFHYAATGQVYGQNVLFLFLLSGFILASNYKPQAIVFVLSVLSLSLFGYGFYIEYSFYGLGVILLIDLYRYWKFKKLYWWCLWSVLHAMTIPLYPLQWSAVFFPLFLPYLDSISAQGIKARWFYWVYPLHFLILWLGLTIHRL